ncbi:MAG: amidohydrolase [Sphaerochaetaceae bacterium]
MQILIKNAIVLPLTSQEVITECSVAVSESKIVGVGTIPSAFKADKIIDATNKIVMPGLINSHTHASMTLFRNFPDKITSLQDWLSQIWPLEDKLEAQHIYSASKLAIAEMIRNGITTFSDFYFFQEETARAVIESKVKANLSLTLFGDEQSSLDRLAKQLPVLKKFREETNGSLFFDIAPHSIYTCSRGSFTLAKEAAQQNSCKVHTHISETKVEVKDSLREFGKTPALYLDSLGILEENRAYLAHGIYLSDEEISLLAKKRIPLVHNPSSNCKLGCGIAPIGKYRDKGVLLALGTDGASSNNSLDLFQEMRLCGHLAAVLTNTPDNLTPYEIVQMATVGGATALGRQEQCGTIEVGKDADLLLIDLDTPNGYPLNNVYSSIVYALNSGNVETVICAGNIILENKKLTTIDWETTKNEFNNAIMSLQ